MRVLVATPLYPPDHGGPATYVRLLEQLLPPEGVEIVVSKFSDVRGLPKVLRHMAYAIHIYKASRGADLILALDPASTGLPALLAARMRRLPFVVKVVGDYAWEQGRQRFGVRATLDEFVYERATHPAVVVLRFIQSQVAKHAHAIIVPSAYLKKIITKWGIPAEKISVIYNAVAIGTVETLEDEPGGLTRPRVVTAGRLVPWKGIGGVIDAVEQLRTTLPDTTLTVIGAGPEEEALMRYAKVRLKGRYVFTGALSHEDTLAVIKDADLFVLNSTYEGLSHLLIEALSLGVPVVATKVGGNAELIEDNVNGVLVPSKDLGALVEACSGVLADKEYAKKLSDAAVRSMERFTTARMATDTKTLLETLV